MAALVYDFNVPVVQSTHFDREYRFVGQDISGAADITIAFKRELNGDVLFAGTNGQVINGPNGEFRVSLEPTDTDAVPPEPTNTFLSPSLDANFELLYFTVVITLAGKVTPLVLGSARYYDNAGIAN